MLELQRYLRGESLLVSFAGGDKPPYTINLGFPRLGRDEQYAVRQYLDRHFQEDGLYADIETIEADPTRTGFRAKFGGTQGALVEAIALGLQEVYGTPEVADRTPAASNNVTPLRPKAAPARPHP